MNTPELQIKNIIVFPTFKEVESLYELLEALVPRLKPDTAIIIADDSGLDYQNGIVDCAQKNMKQYQVKFLTTFSESKSGRGAAILRGFKLGIKHFPNLEYFVEADSDGSHRADDILKILEEPTGDVVIGSRYLKASRIIGWPLKRRIMSKVVNIIAPRILGIQSTDITNGLRRYSMDCVHHLTKYEPITTGFIYLSEQLLISLNGGYKIHEAPITFIDRTHGKSSVGLSEIRDSTIGLYLLHKKYRRLK